MSFATRLKKAKRMFPMLSKRKTFRKNLDRKTMLAGGWGHYGPYFLVNRRIGNHVSTKISVGSKGKIIGGKYKGKNINLSADYNLTTNYVALNVKVRKTK